MMKKIFLLALVSTFLFSCQESSKENQNTTEAPVSHTAEVVKKDSDSDLWLGSLITATPQEGRDLAIQMARKTIGAIQSDGEIKKRVREQYADDAEFLIMAGHVVAVEFQTVAAANNYWR